MCLPFANVEVQALSVRVEYVRFDYITLADSTPEDFALVK